MSYIQGNAKNPAKSKTWVYGPDGKKWFWQLECDHEEDGICSERLFFWDSTKSKTGMIEFRGEQTLHFSRIRQRVLKLAKDPEYRKQFTCGLRFLRSGRVEPI